MKLAWVASGLATLPLLAFAQNSSLPIVDLGYERHQAIAFDNTSGAYNFSNIRYAQAPVGDLRFRAPVPAWNSPNSSDINNGSVPSVCPQANPLWQNITAGKVLATVLGLPFNSTPLADSIYGNYTALQISRPTDPRISEDCLHLDISVPQEIFNNGSKGYGAPVLVWIFGGGFTAGEKTDAGVTDPTGLFAAAQKATGQKFIWVTMNYRLGAFGWLSGPTVSADGVANAGLLDQRLALEWVQKYIHQFGGDPNRVTVMGESSGGGSIMHQITAYSGLKKLPFAQAIPQSPGYFPVSSRYQQESTLGEFLKLANVSSLSEARNASTEALQQANYYQVANSLYGTFTYGPAVDGSFAPQLPGPALAAGNFAKDVRLLLGHNANEGFLFTAPNVTTNEDFSGYIQSVFPTISDQVLNTITQQLYPPPSNGSTAYANNFERADLVAGEGFFTCNTFMLSKAFGNQTYNYQFSAPPPYHGQDVPYTFAKNPNSTQYPLASMALQQYITTFVINGVPSNVNNDAVIEFPVYGPDAQIVNINKTLSHITDPNASPQCNFWQQGLFY